MVLALDPGFRTGCKLVILGRQGQLLHSTTIFPHSGERQAAEAATAYALCVKNSLLKPLRLATAQPVGDRSLCSPTYSLAVDCYGYGQRERCIGVLGI